MRHSKKATAQNETVKKWKQTVCRQPLRQGFFSARRGVSLVEVIIIIILIAVALGAIMTTISSSLNLLASTRQDLGAHLMVANWFEMIESYDAEQIVGDFADIAREIALKLDPNAESASSGYRIHGFIVRATISAISGVNGIVRINLTIDNNGSVVEQQKILNTISNATVSQDLH